MDFKENDVCFTYFCDIVECKILKLYPNSDRYKISQGDWVRTVKASELHITRQAVVIDLVSKIDAEIAYREERKSEIKLKYNYDGD